MTQHERSVLVATCLSSLGSFYTMAVTGAALPLPRRVPRQVKVGTKDDSNLCAWEPRTL